MSKFPDVVIIVRSSQNFENIAQFEILGRIPDKCRDLIKVGNPIAPVVLCLVARGFVNAQAENAVIFFRPREC